MTNGSVELDSTKPLENSSSKSEVLLCVGCGGPESGGGLSFLGEYYCSSCWKRPPEPITGARTKRRRRCSGRGFGLDRFCTCGIRPGAYELEDPDYFGKYAYFSHWSYDLNLPEEVVGKNYIDTHCHLDFLLQNIRSGGVSWTYKTELCEDWMTNGTCPYNECGFAHGESEVRPRYPLTVDDLRSFARRHPVAGVSKSEANDDTSDEVCGSIAPPILQYLVTSACDLSAVEDCNFLSKVTTPYLGGSVYVTFGCHPHTYREYTAEYERRILEALEACGNRAVGIGECGLDYFKNYWDSKKPIERARMIEVFERQTKLAIERDLPLVVHTRDADEDTLRVLRTLPRSHKVHVHAFQGTVEVMKEIFALLPNSVIGVSGIIMKNFATDETLEVATHCPLDRMVLESDAPFLTGEPREIPCIAVKVAELKGISAIEVLETTNQNSEAFYNFSGCAHLAPSDTFKNTM